MRKSAFVMNAARTEPARRGGPTTSRKSALLAAVLSGLGPGAGHAYVGRPRRGAILVALLGVTSAAFILAIPVSYTAARLFSFPPMILVIALIADSARLARAADPVARPWQRWWVYLGIVAVTGFLVPSAFAAVLQARVAIMVAPDDELDPKVQDGDWVVVERGGLPRVSRGDVVVVARRGRAPMMRRLIALPGERFSVVRGVADVDGAALPARLSRPLFAQDLTLPSSRLGESELLVLGDRRRREEARETRVAAADLLGRAAWILLPADHDFIRIGERP